MHNQTQANTPQAKEQVEVSEFLMENIESHIDNLELIYLGFQESDMVQNSNRFDLANFAGTYRDVMILLRQLKRGTSNKEYYKKTIDAQKKHIEDLQGTIKTLSANLT